MRLKLGTRGSKLALTQAQTVADALRCNSPSLEIETIVIRTEGDRNQHESLTVLGGTGVFVREIEQALLRRKIDFAVHSLKDLPTTQPPGVLLVAIIERRDPRDVLVSRGYKQLADLPAGARIGSSAQRRSAQILALRPDVEIRDIRGNVDTRLRKLDEGQYDAIVLAASGLLRLSLEKRISQYFTFQQMVPAVGQGALAVECRADDADTIALLKSLEHPSTRTAVVAERAFLHTLGGGCQLPIGAFAEIKDLELQLHGLIARPDGTEILRDEIRGLATHPEVLGSKLAELLMERGGRKLVETAASSMNRSKSPTIASQPSPTDGTGLPINARNTQSGNCGSPGSLKGKRIVVTRAREQAEELSEKLRAHGAIPVEWPMIAILPPADAAPLQLAMQRMHEYDWVVFSSVNAVERTLGNPAGRPAPPRHVAAVGSKTAAAVERHGWHVGVVPDEFLASRVAEVLGDVHEKNILILCPDITPHDLAQSLRARSALVDEVIAYRTVPVPHCQTPDINSVDAITFASASAARNFAQLMKGKSLPDCVCTASIGPSTSMGARETGLRIDVEAKVHTLDGLVGALTDYYAGNPLAKDASCAELKP